MFLRGRSRKTSFVRDYDRLFGLLKYERDHLELCEKASAHCADRLHTG